MSNINERTEAYAEAEENYVKEWDKLHGDSLKQHLEEIDVNLSIATSEAYLKILNLFTDESFFNTYITTTKMHYLFIIMNIYREELESGEEYTVLKLGRDADTIISYLHELKFILWRIEFAKDEAADGLLLDFIINNNISVCTLEKMIASSCYDIIKVSIHILNIFTSNNMLRHTYQLLKFINKIDSGNKSIICMLEELEAVFRKEI